MIILVTLNLNIFYGTKVTRVTSAHLSEKKMGFLDLKGEADQNSSTPIPSELG